MPLQKSPSAHLPTRYGLFTIIAYKEDKAEHVALTKGNLSKDPLVRIHSQCLTGDALASLRCDCGEQLQQTLKILSKEDGVLIHLQQEGRGIGLFNKITAYHHQDKGLDTVEANTKLGFKDDAREYAIAAEILRDLGVSSIRLLTNNPRKIQELQQAGIQVKERVPLIISPNKMNESYLQVKKKKLGHVF